MLLYNQPRHFWQGGASLTAHLLGLGYGELGIGKIWCICCKCGAEEVHLLTVDTKAWEVDTLRGHINNVSCAIFHARQAR